MNRRDAIKTLASATVATTLPAPVESATSLRFGYAAITWGGDDRQAQLVIRFRRRENGE